MIATEPKYVTLPPTASYARRRVGWFAGGTDGRLGTMRIVIQKGKKPADSDPVDEYAVWEQPAAPGERAFVLVKEDGSDIYRCLLGKRWASCSCEAGKRNRECKHVAALREHCPPVTVEDEPILTPGEVPMSESKPMTLATIVKQYQPAQLATVDEFERAFALAEGVKQVREGVREVIDRILPLQGSSLGFRTDKDKTGGYPEAVVIECATEALLRGLRLTGNEWNIIGGRCYVAQAGCARLVGGYPGLTDLEHAPSVPVMKDGGAIVEYTVNWKLDGVPMTLTRKIPVRVDQYTSMDAILGKAKRKMLAAVYERLTGSVLSEGDSEDAAVPMKSAQNPAPAKLSLYEMYANDIREAATEAALKAVVDDINKDIKRISKDESRLLTSLVMERKKQIADAKPVSQDAEPDRASQSDEETVTAQH